MTGDQPDPVALAHVLADLREHMDTAEAAEVHALIVTDPQTGRRSVVGPFPSRLSARVAGMLLRQRNVMQDPELGDLSYEPVPFDPWETPRPPSGT